MNGSSILVMYQTTPCQDFLLGSCLYTKQQWPCSLRILMNFASVEVAGVLESTLNLINVIWLFFSQMHEIHSDQKKLLIKRFCFLVFCLLLWTPTPPSSPSSSDNPNRCDGSSVLLPRTSAKVNHSSGSSGHHLLQPSLRWADFHIWNPASSST